MNPTNILIIGGIVLGAAIIGYISSRYLGPDNPIEEACEKIIQDETGASVELDGTTKTTTMPIKQA
jgi:Na+/citrate or Na+/malate symporter